LQVGEKSSEFRPKKIQASLLRLAVAHTPASRDTIYKASIIGFGSISEDMKKGIVVEGEVRGVAGSGANDVGALDGVMVGEDGL
jgi:hypothetical protein